MKAKQLTATKLRIILISTLILIVAVCVTAFTFANNKLKAVALDVSHAVVDADASQNNLVALQTIQRELAQQQNTITRTKGIVADSLSYQYQNQIIASLTDYATRANISITNLSFASTTEAATATTGAATPVPGTATPSAAPAGVKAASITVAIASPVNYQNLLSFINLVEQSLTKMQIATINFAPDATDPTKVTSDALTLEVYIK